MTLGSHQKCVGKTQTHITPRQIVDRLGPFDLDPAAADLARGIAPRRITLKPTTVLSGPGAAVCGSILLSIGIKAGAWVERLADHGNGILLLHARVETDWFRPVWQHADTDLNVYRLRQMTGNLLTRWELIEAR